MFYEHNQSKSVMCTDLCLIEKTRDDMKCRAVQSWCYSRMQGDRRDGSRQNQKPHPEARLPGH